VAQQQTLPAVPARRRPPVVTLSRR
jgi:hypothetical protein